MTTPPYSMYDDDTIVSYLDMAAIPKEFFIGKQMDNLFTPKEMKAKMKEIEMTTITIEVQ